MQPGTALRETVDMLPRCISEQERTFGAYCQAIGEKIRDGPPLACASIDRRALHAFAKSLSDDNVAALTCFSCAQVWPRVGDEKSLDIEVGASVPDLRRKRE